MQTDRQTDKALHWKTAVFDIDGQWEALEKLPDFVKELHRQLEVCPETGKQHYQCHVVCHRQVRLTQMSSWIRKTKWFAVLGKQHIANSIAYVSKKDSAVAGTQQVTVGETYYSLLELLQIVADRCWYHIAPFEYFHTGLWMSRTWDEREKAYKKQLTFKSCAKYLVSDYTKWLNKLSNPMVGKLWNDFSEVLLREAEEKGSFIIEEPPPEVLLEHPEVVEYFLE